MSFDLIHQLGLIFEPIFINLLLYYSHMLSDEYTNRWDDAFYAAGFFIAIAGVLAWITGVMVARDDDTDDDGES